MYDFSSKNYRKVLNLFKQSDYKILRFCDLSQPQTHPKQMLLRHDVDFSLDYALDMAKVEAEEKVQSTYFVMMYSDFYSVFNAKSRDILLQIKSLGHEIGLHYEASMWGENKSAFNQEFSNDLKQLGKIIGEPVVSAAQHNPIDSEFFNIEHLVQHEAYSKKIREQFFYISDSAMTWREYTPEMILNKKDHIQFLAHPIWWMTKQSSIKDKLNEMGSFSASLYQQKVEQFNAYLEYCLSQRKEFDKKFMEKRGL